MQLQRLFGGCLAYALFWLGCLAHKLGHFDIFGRLYQRAMRGSSDWQDKAGWGPWHPAKAPDAQPHESDA